MAGGDAGLRVWESAQSAIGISFDTNSAESRLDLATAKTDDGRFAIDALATDGGGIRRNDLCSRGLALVHLDAPNPR